MAKSEKNEQQGLKTAQKQAETAEATAPAAGESPQKPHPTAAMRAEMELKEVEFSHILALGEVKLVELCHNLRLPIDVNEERMAQQLKALKLGGDKKFVGGGLSICPICRHLATVDQTKRVGGETTLRRMRCAGKRGHIFSLPM